MSKLLDREAFYIKIKKSLIFLIILFIIPITTNLQLLNAILITPTEPFDFGFLNSLRDKSEKETNFIDNLHFKNNEFNSTNQSMHYVLLQEAEYQIETSSIKQFNSTSDTNVSIKTNIINSSFQILSNAEEDYNEWKDTSEDPTNNVTISRISLGNNTFFQYNFTQNQDRRAETTNIRYNVSANPLLTDYSTKISFDFRIPYISPEILASFHQLYLEFKFNGASIIFYLLDSDDVVINSGIYLEENIVRSNSTIPNPISLSIICNGSLSSLWKHISYNITDIITNLTYFTFEERESFSKLETLNLVSLASSGYQITLEMDNIGYLTTLSSNVSINYTIGQSTIYSENGLMNFNAVMNNFTFTAQENSPWNESLKTAIEVNITRNITKDTFYFAKNWNETIIEMNVNLSYFDILENMALSYIQIVLPSDWKNISISGENINVEFLNETVTLNEYIQGYLYIIDVYGVRNITLKAFSPNYLSNIQIDSDIIRNEVVNIRGILKYPLPGIINLFIFNETLLFYSNTLSMLNSTFIFTGIIIDSQFPLGLLRLTINWSYSLEYGNYEKLIYIHDDNNIDSEILFHTQPNSSFYQFENLNLNVSLIKNGMPYITSDANVFLLKGNEVHYFTKTITNSFYLLNISVIWDPGIYFLEIIASNANLFFAKTLINVTVNPAHIFWSFENLPASLSLNENLNFRLYTYLQLQATGVLVPLAALKIKIWINDTLITEEISSKSGIIDFNITPIYSIFGDRLSLTIGGFIEKNLIKIQTLIIPVVNTSIVTDAGRAFLDEVMRSHIIANNSFYIYYNVSYTENSSKWYVPFSSYFNSIEAAFLLRNNYVIGIELINQSLFWNLEANNMIIDTLVIKIPAPKLYLNQLEYSEIYRCRIDIYSELTISNFTAEINLSFLGLPLLNVTLLDSLSRDISEFYLIESKGTMIIISGLNIIRNIQLNYFLEGVVKKPEIRSIYNTKDFYQYNESILVYWRIDYLNNYPYSVYYTISGEYIYNCYNTSRKDFMNGTTEIIATISPQKWNSTISAQLIINIFTGKVISSQTSDITIIDLFAPTLDYSIEYTSDSFIVHTFLYEPEKASGIHNIEILNENSTIASSLTKSNYQSFEFSSNNGKYDKIQIKAIDLAGNIVLSELIKIREISISSQSLLELFNSQLLVPMLFSSAIIGGILISREIKKRKTSIF